MSPDRSFAVFVFLWGLLGANAVSAAEKAKPKVKPRPVEAVSPLAPPRFTPLEIGEFSDLCVRAGGVISVSLQGAGVSCVKGGAAEVAAGGSVVPPAAASVGSAPAAPTASRAPGAPPSNWDLCGSYAEAVARRRPTASLEAEIRRRGLGCAGSMTSPPATTAPPPARAVAPAPRSSYQTQPARPRIAPNRTDTCAGLSIVNITKVQRGTIFTVANANARSRSFRIHYRGIQSSRFVIPARATQSFGVEISGTLGALGALGARSRGEGDELINDCVALAG